MEEEALKWIKERLGYIAEGCDLKNEDNKRAFDSLKFAKESIERLRKKEK